MRTEKKIFFVVLVVYSFLVIIYSWRLYVKELNLSLAYTNAILHTAAFSLDQILGRDFHDKYNMLNPVPEADYRQLVEKLNSYAKGLNIEYVYSMVRVDDRIYFVVSNETEDDIKRGTPSRFYNPYYSAPADLYTAFNSGKEIFSTSNMNEWGSFRSVFIPGVSPGGIQYVLSADVKLEAIQGLYRKVLAVSGMQALFFLLPLLPGFLAYRYINRQRQRKLAQNLYYDHITGLPNRSKLINDYTGHMENKLSAVIYDINSFNQINNVFGRETGDMILKDVGRLLQQYLPKGMNLYRLDADEYIAVIENTDRPELEKYTQEMLSVFSKSVFYTENTEIYILLKAGLVLNCRDYEDLLTYSAIAKHKARGNFSGYHVYDYSEDLKSVFKNNLSSLKDIKNAISDDRILPYFQPIRNIVTGKIEKYEALARMVDVNGSIHSPASFLAIAETALLYSEITKIIIQKTCRIFACRMDSVSLNLITTDFLNADTIDFLLECINSYNLHGRVIIELVESDSFSEYDMILPVIKKLKSNGIQVAIDDFGSGYSNFNYLLEMDADFIKIDGTLISKICESVDSHLIVKSIVSFAHRIDIKVIAEFISDLQLYDAAAEMNINFAQGYYVGKPLEFPLAEA